MTQCIGYGRCPQDIPAGSWIEVVPSRSQIRMTGVQLARVSWDGQLELAYADHTVRLAPGTVAVDELTPCYWVLVELGAQPPTDREG